jgi:formate dehydrogenase subunit delta
MHTEHLVSMANDIAAFFSKAADHGEAARSVATHLHRYWDPRMRKKIFEHQQSGGEGLSDLAREGVTILMQELLGTRT